MKKTSIFLMFFLYLIAFCFPAYGSVYTNGPSGGYGGKPFYIWPALPRDKMKIIEIRISAGSLIDSIEVVYKYNNGITRVEGPFGGSGGRQHVFRLDDDEYLIGVYGWRDNLIHSIRFVTNKKESPTYGGKGGNIPFRYKPSGNLEIAGFFGRSGRYIDAVGVFYRIIDQSKPVAFDKQLGKAFFSGGNGGSFFKISRPYEYDSDIRFTISKINLWVDNLVNGLQVIYKDRLDGTEWGQSPIYGNQRGIKKTFLLKGNEFITAIYGKYGAVIDSITFETNKRNSPKYGGSGGVQWYRYEAPKESIINGFIGYSGIHIDSIGIITDSIFGRFEYDADAIIYTPQGSVVNAKITREVSLDELRKLDKYFNEEISKNGWNAHIISKSTATYNCHGYAWHGNKRGEKFNISGAEISKYWEDGSYTEIEKNEATWGDIIYYRGEQTGLGLADHSAVITNKTDRGLWCISKWYTGPLVGHFFKDCPYYKESYILKYYRKNAP